MVSPFGRFDVPLKLQWCCKLFLFPRSCVIKPLGEVTRVIGGKRGGVGETGDGLF